MLGTTVQEAMNRMDSVEFAEWEAFERLNPSEPERGDMNHAYTRLILASLFSPVNLGINDFMLKFDNEPKKIKTGNDIKTKLNQWLTLHNRQYKEE
jgi:hypothetical protein